MIQTSEETENMARYADEFTMTAEEENKYLRELEENPRAVMISAYIEDKLAANGGLNLVSLRERCKHRAEFGISVKKDYWGIGVGSAVMEAIIESARKANYEQIELEVVDHKKRGIGLYNKFGFEIYGKRDNSCKYRDGRTAG